MNSNDASPIKRGIQGRYTDALINPMETDPVLKSSSLFSSRISQRIQDMTTEKILSDIENDKRLVVHALPPVFQPGLWHLYQQPYK